MSKIGSKLRTWYRQLSCPHNYYLISSQENYHGYKEYTTYVVRCSKCDKYEQIDVEKLW